MFEFKFADIGEGIHEGKLLKWFFNEGDEVKEGENLFLVETDKVNAEIPSPVSGKIAKKMAEVGEIINVGDVVVTIDDGSKEETKVEDKTSEDNKKNISEDEEEGGAGVVGQIEVSSEVIESSHEGANKEAGSQRKKVLATPVARKLAKDLGIDITTIEGTGPAGRVMKEDIHQAKDRLNKGEESKADGKIIYNSPIKIPEIKITGDSERVSLSMLRKTIAKNMVLSKSVIPHASTMDDFDVTKLVEFRNQHKEVAKEQGIYLTYMPFIMKAVTIALKEFPVFNSSYDDGKEELILKKYYNLGMAVDTPDGLIVPVVKDTDRKSILEIAREMDELKEQARTKSIPLDKLQNGTFTITNYGAIGASHGIPVIKHPEVAILGVGKITKKPVVVDNEIVIRDILPISLCIDHRVIDGGDAGRFLIRLRELLSNPMLLVLS